MIDRFNLGSGRALPLLDFITEVCVELGLDVEPKLGLIQMHPYEPSHSVADITHAKGVLGWRRRHRLSHAVWQLARDAYPSLMLKEPVRYDDTI